MLDHVLPPSGLPPWADGDSHIDHLQMAVRSLRHDPRAARTAREFTSAALRSWELAPLIDDTGVVVSELVTNAVRHGVRDGGGGRSAQDVRVILCHTERSVLCAVTDPSDQGPSLREPDYEAENGRGLQLVQGVSEMWGWAPLESRGKAVWAAFAVPSRAARHLEACH
ncbi:ATP-binding protein [Streptosporangium roseum]|uniref:Signal transduction histidine kinase n=1 Tax=Streptosporangium roseum (strain ATCC 12428 / DSM 43021 / JCM 3005 / KCTC 9067 / NCIMB 10171 / NRRL 2505 / NI 9100) TaxID=479432 RepID=D2AR40_STRRD|nr:ATP-binding protein [Streptosporangium roseum]ACZ88381.1 putative signal transduction histidine kinase [Streptosporangium roseum DSM 43021]